MKSFTICSFILNHLKQHLGIIFVFVCYSILSPFLICLDQENNVARKLENNEKKQEDQLKGGCNKK